MSKMYIYICVYTWENIGKVALHVYLYVMYNICKYVFSMDIINLQTLYV